MHSRTLLALLVLAVAALGPCLAQEAPAAAKPKLVVHLSKGTSDLHAVSMALKLAAVCQQQGGEVTLFLDLEGPRVADARQPMDLSWGHSAPMVEMYDAFVKAGGQTLVCPHCAMAAGLKAENLRPGARIATPDELAKLLLATDKILDY